jgi:hypothetical protein
MRFQKDPDGFTLICPSCGADCKVKFTDLKDLAQAASALVTDHEHDCEWMDAHEADG